MGVALLWAIYIIVVIAVWVVLWVPQLCIALDMVLSAFIALVVGAIVIFLLSPTVGMHTLDKAQSGWLSALFIIAYLLPILLLLWIILAGYVDIKKSKYRKMKKHHGAGKSHEMHGDLDNCKFQMEVVCNEQGECRTSMKGMKCDQGEARILYV